MKTICKSCGGDGKFREAGKMTEACPECEGLGMVNPPSRADYGVADGVLGRKLVKTARQRACEWTSRWATIACPALDRGLFAHSQMCDSLTLDIELDRVTIEAQRVLASEAHMSLGRENPRKNRQAIELLREFHESEDDAMSPRWYDEVRALVDES